MKRWFVTGTDTGIGKTYVACLLIRHLVAQGHRVAAMKPVSSGSETTATGLRNQDALNLMAEANVKLDYATVNPYCYQPAIAPHIAAQEVSQPVDLDEICRRAQTIEADHLVIEGVGGWQVPLNDQELLPALVGRLDARVIMVVGMRLGCINHALLTAKQIQRDGCRLAGWVANILEEDMPAYQNNLKTLINHLPVPLLSEIRRNAVTSDWARINPGKP